MISKITIDGKETIFSFGIDEEEIETNEEVNSNTIELDEVIKSINGKS